MNLKSILYDVYSKRREYISGIGISLISVIIWEYGLKPFLTGYYPQIEYFNGLIIGIFIFQFIIYSNKPTDLDEILNEEDQKLLAMYFEEIKKLEHTRLKYTKGGSRWIEYTNELYILEARKKELEDRIRERLK